MFRLAFMFERYSDAFICQYTRGDVAETQITWDSRLFIDKQHDPACLPDSEPVPNLYATPTPPTTPALLPSFVPAPTTPSAPQTPRRGGRPLRSPAPAPGTPTRSAGRPRQPIAGPSTPSSSQALRTINALPAEESLHPLVQRYLTIHWPGNVVTFTRHLQRCDTAAEFIRALEQGPELQRDIGGDEVLFIWDLMISCM